MAAIRSCQSYFDWHPVIGGLILLAVSALSVTALFSIFATYTPSLDGWAIITPLNGAFLAVLLLSRRQLWPFLLVGYVLALSEGTVMVGAARHPKSLEIFGSVLELVLAAFTLPPFRNLKQWLQEPRLLRAFTGYALLLGPAILSLMVAQSLSSTDNANEGLHVVFWQRARIIGFSESLGVALGTPLLLILANRQTYQLFRWRMLPATLSLYSLLGLSTWFVFTRPTWPAILLPYAILIVIAFFLGVRGAVLGITIAGTIVIFVGPHAPVFANQPSALQSVLALAILTVFPLSVTLFNRSDLEVRVKDYQAELDKLKSLDRLTGVANRKRFDLVLVREWQRATRDPKPISLLMIDADFFDLYNDSYGTKAGDACLRLIASKLAEQPHRQYDLVSRFEGGRFSVLLPGAEGDAVQRIAEEFRGEIAALEWPHESSKFGRVTVSVGWATMLPDTDRKPELLVSAAEAALLSAKRKGRNRVEGFPGKVVEMPVATT